MKSTRVADKVVGVTHVFYTLSIATLRTISSRPKFVLTASSVSPTMRINTMTAQRLLTISLFTFITIVCASGHPNERSTEQSQELTSPQTTTDTVTEWMEIEQGRRPSRQGVSPPPFKSRRPPAVGIDVGCRKRVVCEAARALTHVVPLSGIWQNIIRGRPEPKSPYFAAWSKGFASNDCSEFYPDCYDSPAGMVLPMVNEVVGPKGLFSTFLGRLAAPSAPHVARDPGAPRPSLVMQKLRQSQRRLESQESQTPTDDFTPRLA